MSSSSRSVTVEAKNLTRVTSTRRVTAFFIALSLAALLVLYLLFGLGYFKDKDQKSQNAKDNVVIAGLVVTSIFVIAAYVLVYLHGRDVKCVFETEHT